MPEYPPIAGLKAAVERKILPRPASAHSSPQLDRAVEQLRRAYPADMAGLNIEEMPWSHGYAGTNTLGTTDQQNTIDVNPAMVAYPQAATESVLAHELQHTRQNNEGRVDESSIEYFDRPREIDARRAAELYDAAKGSPSGWSMIPPIRGLHFPQSPLVKPR